MFGCLGLEGKKGRDSVNTTGMDQGRRYCLMFCTTQWMQRHTTSHLVYNMRRDFQWGSGGREAEACTPPDALHTTWCIAHHLVHCLEH